QPPARLVQKFTDHTGGNPFFVAELFRHLNDERRVFDARPRGVGALGLDAMLFPHLNDERRLFDARQRWMRDLDFDDIELPGTVRVMLERRLQRVSPETADVLKAAAVIGRHFEPDVLEAAAGIDSDRLITALDEAERAGIVKGPSGRREVT